MGSPLRLTAMLAMAAPVLSAGPAPAQVPQAAALPPPPYAADARAAGLRPTLYGGAQGFDRYGGGGSHPPVQAAYGPSAAPVPYQGPRLGWSGKTDAPSGAQPAAYASRPYQAATYAPAPSPTPYRTQAPRSHDPQPQDAAAPAGWRYIPPIGPREPAPPAPPTSIYAPPRPVATAADATGARHYSVHRDYGIQPDPIPLPPQFFGATADMSKPETDEPVRRTVTADGKSHNALQPSDGQ